MPVDTKVSTLIINQVPYSKRNEPTYQTDELYFVEDNFTANKFVKTNSNKELVTVNEVKTSELTNDSGFITSTDISGKEDKSNKVTSLSASSTDTQYPSAKCMWDIIGNLESLILGL